MVDLMVCLSVDADDRSAMRLPIPHYRRKLGLSRRSVSVNNRTLLLLSTFSVLALGLVVVAIGVVSAARLNLSSGVFAASLALCALGLLAGAVAWLLGLMRTARDGRWEWFVEILVLGALGVLIFSVASLQSDVAGREDAAALSQ
jgi:hypothetical protein